MTVEIAPAKGYEPSKDGTHTVFTKPIEVSQNDERSYRLVRLHNDLEVLLIHDAAADKSAAALDVHVGHLSDPDNIQGLAHFLEHLLFLGTAKYPRENEYKQFLSLHAGKCNASTSLDHTCYHFEVGHAFLEGALDRFAQFFISPNFNEDCKVREMHAVDSEFKRNLQNDQRRLFQIGKHLSSRQHPYWHFGTGNLLTLLDGPLEQGIDVRDELIKFYHRYYSSNIMKLVILGREPLDQLAAWAVEKFSDIKNLGIPPPSYLNPPLTSKELLKMVHVKPVKDTRTLEIKFLIPDDDRYYAIRPTHYICHVLGQQGRGSILSFLKKAAWANRVTVEASSGGIGFEFLKIRLDLTETGLLHYEDITVIVFQYIQLLRQEGVKSYIWDEMVSLTSTAFRFKAMMPAFMYVVGTAKTMQRGYAPEHVLSGYQVIRGNDPQIVMEYINELRTDNWMGLVVTQDQTLVPGGAFTERERWYGTKYHIGPVTTTLLKRLEHLEPHPELHMPVPNDYIPNDFEVHKDENPAPPLTNPILIKHTSQARVWHKKDDIFWVPKVNMYFYLRSPLAVSSPATAVKSMLYLNLVKDALNEEAYSAKQAGLVYMLEMDAEGIILQIEGYNDKANLLLEKVIHTMRTLKVDPDRFWRIKDQLFRSHRNNDLENPNLHANYFLTCLNEERKWTYLDRLQELEHVDSPEEIQQFYPEILRRLHIEALVHGNMDAAQALQAGEIVEKGLATRALVPSELIGLRSSLLPEGCRAIYQRQTADANNLNSAIQLYIQIDCSPSSSTRKTNRALVQILAQVIQEPCFNQLRTIEQLGYIVQSGIRQHAGTLGLKIAVQSERDPVYVESRIQEFLRTRIVKMLDEMDEASFRKQVHSLVQKMLEKDKNLRMETTRYWAQVTSGYYHFEEVKDDVEELEKLTLDQARQFFQHWILPDATQVRKLSVHIRSQKLLPLPVSELSEGTIVIEDMVRFKAGLELSQAPSPVVDLLRYSKL
ncbi:Insulinase (Peptidase M16) [Mortierella sp. GBA30]|nr:Insulinase (Peptidase M16) [Mortierella sp. GBA30]